MQLPSGKKRRKMIIMMMMMMMIDTTITMIIVTKPASHKLTTILSDNGCEAIYLKTRQDQAGRRKGFWLLRWLGILGMLMMTTTGWWWRGWSCSSAIGRLSPDSRQDLQSFLWIRRFIFLDRNTWGIVLEKREGVHNSFYQLART